MKNPFYKITFLILVLFLLPAVHAIAGFSIPDDAYRMSELDNAIEEAREDNWPMAFVLTDENTTCSLASNASEVIFNILSEDCIIVYVLTSNAEVEDLPKIVQKGMSSKETGKYYPITVIVNSKMNRIIDIVPYNRGQAHVDRLREALEKIAVEPTFLEEMKYKLINFFE